MKAKGFPPKFKDLVLAEYPNMPSQTKDAMMEDEVIFTRYLDEQSELTDWKNLYAVGKDTAWELIERTVYRKEMYAAACTIQYPTDDNVLVMHNFIEKHKWRLE